MRLGALCVFWRECVTSLSRRRSACSLSTSRRDAARRTVVLSRSSARRPLAAAQRKKDSRRSTLPSLSTRARRRVPTRVRARATWSAREAVPPLVSSSGAPLAEAISLVALRSRGATSARALLHSTAAMCRDRLIALSQCVCGESTAGGNVQGAVCGRSKTAPRALRTASVARRLHEASGCKTLGRLKSAVAFAALPRPYSRGALFAATPSAQLQAQRPSRPLERVSVQEQRPAPSSAPPRYPTPARRPRNKSQ